MDRVKLFICTRNKEYGEKLLRFIAGQHNPDMDAELLTGTPAELVSVIRGKTEQGQDTYVVSDHTDVPDELECRFIRLVTMPEADRGKEIFMYQRGRDIYEQILQLTGVQARCAQKGVDLSLPKVSCVFSPGESDEKTFFSLRMAADRAERGRVLYVSLCGFPVLFPDCEDGQVKTGTAGVSDLMLCIEQDMFEQKLGELARPRGSISLLAPAGHFRDLFDFTQEEIKRFVKHLRQQTQYDAVVMETGQLFEFTFALLSEADAVFVPEKPGIFAETKRQVFREYCMREGQGDLWERIQFVPVSADVPADWEEIRQIIGEREGEHGKSGEKGRGKGKKREDPKIGFGSDASRYRD